MDTPKPYNAENERHVKSRKDRERREAERHKAAVSYVMGNPLGRLFVWNLLAKAGVFTDGFTGNNTTFYNEGRRGLGLQLLGEIEALAAPDFLRMWSEHLATKAHADAEDEAVRSNGDNQSQTEG